MASIEFLATVELPAEDDLRDEGNDLQAAPERLELPASAELLTTVELLAEDELPDEGGDLQVALERLELPASVEHLAAFELLQPALEGLELPASAELLAEVKQLADDELLGEGDDLHAAGASQAPGLSRARGIG